jgi:homoserine kinase type II
MGVFTSLDDAAASRIARAYGLGSVRATKGIPAGSVNSNYAFECDSGRFFLRIYEEQDAQGAAVEARMLAHLESRGVRTPAPLATVAGAEEIRIEGKPVAVFPWRDGALRCQAGVTADDARKVGAELARVHVAGEGFPIGAGRFRVEDLRARLTTIAGADDPELASQAPILGAKLDAWSTRSERRAAPMGLVHGDLFRDNVLWSADGEVAALLDFESASRGAFAFDLMVLVLSWSFGDAFDEPIARGIVTGYRSVRELEAGDSDALLPEACFAATRFTITRITDYAMKRGIGARVIKDWRRFAMRLRTLEDLGDAGLRRALGLEGANA